MTDRSEEIPDRTLDDPIPNNTNNKDKDFAHYENTKEQDKLQDMPDYTQHQRYQKRQYVQLQGIKKLTKLPETGESIKIITTGQFNAYAFVQYIQEQEPITEMYLAVYSIDNKTIQKIIDNCKYYPTTLIISTIRKNTNVKKDQLLEEIREAGGQVIYAFNHAKIIACKTHNNYYTIEGSGNFAQNARIEQYTLDNSAELYHFHKNWITDIGQRLGYIREHS